MLDIYTFLVYICLYIIKNDKGACSDLKLNFSCESEIRSQKKCPVHKLIIIFVKSEIRINSNVFSKVLVHTPPE